MTRLQLVGFATSLSTVFIPNRVEETAAKGLADWHEAGRQPIPNRLAYLLNVILFIE
jgi:hypothetical protein